MAIRPDASVMPYTSYSPTPVTCRKRSPTARGSEAAPQNPARIVPMSASPTGTSSTAPMPVGTAPASVTW
jgi:hypothetical protein